VIVTKPHDRATRWYYRSQRLATAGLRALRGTFDGVWLGVLDQDQLARIDEAYYDGKPQYTAESYNRSGLARWEKAAIDRHFAGAHRLIITSAGGGREVLALAKAGYEVVGFEPHEDLVRFGNQLLDGDGYDARIRTCDRDGWPAEAGHADGVVVGWGGYMLLPGRDRRVTFLKEAARRLPSGAPLLISFFAASHRDLRLRTAARVATPIRWLLHREPVSVGDALVPNLVHFFTRDEIAAELADAGFDLIDFGTSEYGWAVGRVRPTHREDNS
jgi:hypothetical protein